MAGQPPTSPWMGADYFESVWETPHNSNGERDLCWTKNSVQSIQWQNIQWKEVPDCNIRMLNHWDNFDGTNERGYSGRGIFFEDGQFRKDWKLVEDYAKLLQSIRINAVSINNVNVREGARWFITNAHGDLDNIKQINDIFAKYNIKTFIAINFAAPKVVGGLTTSDPLDSAVIDFWGKCANEIYQIIPNFGGFVVKADAEGEPGPLQYGRTHADGANMLGKAIGKYGGLVFWRCFVYSHKQDWRDRKTDRAMAAYNNFQVLDGQFADNVILQIKNGPIDFQVKEPVSSLFGALKKTNQVVEFQITQEYTGQQQHICYLAPIWKEVLNFNTGVDSDNSQVVDVLRDKSPVPANSGAVAVGNVGLDANWTGSKFAQANLYAYGRLMWDSSLTAEQIGQEWVSLTFPELNYQAQEVIYNILLTSRDTYRNYTVPLGIGFMCRPGFHYGVDIDGYEYDAWGTYHFADRNGVGVDRTLKTGSGYIGQYQPSVQQLYEDVATCLDEDLLFFHHVPYNHQLQSGKTVIQHIYDSHFAGVEQVEQYLQSIETLKSTFEQAGYSDDWNNIYHRLQEQLKTAKQWRDVVNTYFYRKSGIQDARAGETGRVIYD